jgi:hypothetical protein
VDIASPDSGSVYDCTPECEGGAGIAVRGGAKKSAVRPTKSRAMVEHNAKMETCLFRSASGLIGSFDSVLVRIVRNVGANLVVGGSKEVRMEPIDDIAVSDCNDGLAECLDSFPDKDSHWSNDKRQ